MTGPRLLAALYFEGGGSLPCRGSGLYRRQRSLLQEVEQLQAHREVQSVPGTDLSHFKTFSSIWRDLRNSWKKSQREIAGYPAFGGASGERGWDNLKSLFIDLYSVRRKWQEQEQEQERDFTTFCGQGVSLHFVCSSLTASVSLQRFHRRFPEFHCDCGVFASQFMLTPNRLFGILPGLALARFVGGDCIAIGLAAIRREFGRSLAFAGSLNLSSRAKT